MKSLHRMCFGLAVLLLMAMVSAPARATDARDSEKPPPIGSSQSAKARASANGTVPIAWTPGPISTSTCVGKPASQLTIAVILLYLPALVAGSAVIRVRDTRHLKNTQVGA